MRSCLKMTGPGLDSLTPMATPSMMGLVSTISTRLPTTSMARLIKAFRILSNGWAQINGLRGDTDIAERIRYDIWYIENWTVALDIKILFRTVFGGKMVNDEKIQ